MNVDRRNFNKFYPEMAAKIKECDLIAFDLEYSGIKLSEQNGYTLFDTIEERYKNIKNCSKSFTTFQLGIVLFSRKVNNSLLILDNASKFYTSTYNINLFPMASDLFDTTFNCSAAALKFLRNYKMDLNDVIDNGVGFLNKDEFDELKKKLDSYSIIHTALTSDQKSLLEMQRKEISEWLMKDKTESISLDLIEGLVPYFHQIYLRSHFIEISTRLTDSLMIVERVDHETRFLIDQKEDECDSKSEKYKFCMEMLGVSKIWKLISRLKKPVVGHNCLFDLVAIYQKFFAPLPETYDDFRFDVHKLMPTVYDTKFIFGRMRINFKELAEVEGGLENIYQALLQINQKNKEHGVVFEEETCEYGNDTTIRKHQAHEAGSDAYMTGCVLIYLANMLYKREIFDLASQPISGGDTGEIKQYDHLMKKSTKAVVASFEAYENSIKSWKNYLNVIRAHEFFISLEGVDFDDGYRTAHGNKLSRSRPPWIIVYDRNPAMHLKPVRNDISGPENTSDAENDETSDTENGDEVYFSQGFLEQLMFEFTDADVRKLGVPVKDERYQKFLVAFPSFNVARAFTRRVRRRWPRLVVKEYCKYSDDPKWKYLLFSVTTASTMLSVWSVISLLKELKLSY